MYKNRKRRHEQWKTQQSETFHYSRPLDIVGRLHLDEVDFVQDVGDVDESVFAGLQGLGSLREVHGPVGSRQQQLQETLRQRLQRHNGCDKVTKCVKNLSYVNICRLGLG